MSYGLHGTGCPANRCDGCGSIEGQPHKVDRRGRHGCGWCNPLPVYYIRTQRQNAYVGGEGSPELFDTRKAARERADELADSTPSSYGRLIVSEWK